MNKKASIASIKEEKKGLLSCFYFIAGTIISFYLSISISNYFYLLAVPLLLITLIGVKLLITSIKDGYKRLIKKEKYFNDGRHLEYFEDKKSQPKFELHIINGERHGSYKSYFINGQIETDCNYKIGKLHGEFKEYYVDGNLKRKTQYKEGIQYGETKSFYNNGNKYREFNLINNEYEGEIKEYFKNGNLKFLKDKNKYTFYDKNNNLKCEVEIEIDEAVNLRDVYVTGYNGLWKNYREDGTLEYELDFDDLNSDLKNKIVSKTIFTKGGELFSKNLIKYEAISMAQVNFSNFYAGNRMEESVYNWDTGMRGPPGIASRHIIKLKSISSINDIIKFL